MTRKTAILDASSAIILAKANLTDLLAEVYAIVMPSSVYAEITAANHPEAIKYIKLAEEKKINVVEVFSRSTADYGLDKGEYDCVQLFNQRAGDFLITDDGIPEPCRLLEHKPKVSEWILVLLLLIR